MASDRMKRAPSELSAIRLVISDIDGTLVRDDKTLAPRTIETVRRLRDAGIGFTLISARPPSGLGGLIEELGLGTPVGAFNGATIFRPGGEIVDANHLAAPVARRIVDTFDGLGIPVWVFADGAWMTRTRDMPHVEQEIVAARQEPVVTPDFERWMDRADKIQGVSDDDERLADAETRLRDLVGGNATLARSQHYYLDATAPHTDKGHGVRELAKTFDVSLDAVAVIGDMPNDLPMFRVAGLAVAMGQAPDTVKAEADIVTTSNQDDGVAAFIATLLERRQPNDA